jgi:inhibitor of the pro-sigma K processing machinery
MFPMYLNSGGDWMGTYLILGAICVLLMILLTIGKRIGYGIIIEKLAIFWFRLACSFAFLYIAHITVDGFDIIVPVNFFSALTITILGFPGVLCIAVLTLLQ